MRKSATKALAVVILTVASALAAGAATSEQVLHSFTCCTDGGYPYSDLIADASGNLYGTASSGGDEGYGDVFQLTPDGQGGWTFQTLFSFDATLSGYEPHGTLLMDSQGNLYGTCALGGRNSDGSLNNGTVFELSPDGHGGWVRSRYYAFHDNVDGAIPYGGLIMDSAGNVYGTTRGSTNGPSPNGTVFELTPTDGGWTETTLHSFAGGDDGSQPYAGVTMDRAGNLYGTTQFGGSADDGVVFKLRDTGSGWTETILHVFTGDENGLNDGAWPKAPLVLDESGRLYGTAYCSTYTCGGSGGVFMLSPSPRIPPTTQQAWRITWLYHFTGGADGGNPTSRVTFDSTGNIYGTTYLGGNSGAGVVYKLTKSQQWAESVLTTFTGGTDGGYPYAGVLLDDAGNLYGTTYAGGAYGYGAVFQVTQ